MKNWYKSSQTISTNLMQYHPLADKLGRIFVADDDSGNYLQLLVIPIAYGEKTYMTVQLDATHGGVMPKSPQLKKLSDAISDAAQSVPQAHFIDDHFDPMEAKLPPGSYKVSKMERVFGPLNDREISGLVSEMEKSWTALADRMIDLELISHYEIKNSAMKTLLEKSSKKEKSAADEMIRKDSQQMRAFLCRLDKLKNSQPVLSPWISDLKYQVTDWVWGSIHGSKYEVIETNSVDCNIAIDKDWAMRFGDTLMSPGREIFMYACGYPRKNHEDIMDVILDMPLDAMSRGGVEQFVEYAADESLSPYLKSWISSLSKDGKSLSKNIIGHPWAVSALAKNHPELSELLRKMQEKNQ